MVWIRVDQKIVPQNNSSNNSNVDYIYISDLRQRYSCSDVGLMSKYVIEVYALSGVVVRANDFRKDLRHKYRTFIDFYRRATQLYYNENP